MSAFWNSRSRYYRSLCWFMAWLMAVSPSLAVSAEQGNSQPVEPLKLNYVVANSAAIVTARPQQLLTSEAVQMMPVEVVTAAGLQYLGFDPVNIKQVVISATPPMAGPPLYTAMIELSQRIDLKKLAPELTRHTVEGELEGQAYLKSEQPFLPSIAWVDETTLLLAPDATLRSLVRNKTAPRGVLVEQLQASNSQDDLLISIDLETLRPLIQIGMAEAAQGVPPELQLFLEIPDLLKHLQIRGSLSGAGPWEVVVDANGAGDADRVEELIEEAFNLYTFKSNEVADTMLASNDPVQRAMGRYTKRITPQWIEQLRPKRDGERFRLISSADIEGQSTHHDKFCSYWSACRIAITSSSSRKRSCSKKRICE